MRNPIGYNRFFDDELKVFFLKLQIVTICVRIRPASYVKPSGAALNSTFRLRLNSDIDLLGHTDCSSSLV